MKTVIRRLALAVALTALAFVTVACGKGPTAPTPSQPPPSEQPNQPPPPVVVYAVTPDGTTNETWRLTFGGDEKLRRPEKGSTIHLDISTVRSDGQAMLASSASLATGLIAGNVTWDINPGSGITAPVTVTDAPIQCGAVLVTVGACTSTSFDATGRLATARIQFTSILVILQNRPAVLKEILRTTAVLGNNPNPGLFAATAWSQINPSPEELVMLLKKFDFEPNSVYAPK